MPATTDTTPIFLTSHGIYCGMQVLPIAFASGAPGTTGWPANGLAIYVPLALPFAYNCQRAWWINGGTAAGSVDVGIYSEAGALIVHTGNIAQSGANARQIQAMSTVLQAGSYYLAISLSSSTGTVFRATANIDQGHYRTQGLLQQAAANPLPASMTPATIANLVWPCFGITRTASGF